MEDGPFFDELTGRRREGGLSLVSRDMLAGVAGEEPTMIRNRANDALRPGEEYDRWVGQQFNPILETNTELDDRARFEGNVSEGAREEAFAENGCEDVGAIEDSVVEQVD